MCLAPMNRRSRGHQTHCIFGGTESGSQSLLTSTPKTFRGSTLAPNGCTTGLILLLCALASAAHGQNLLPVLGAPPPLEPGKASPLLPEEQRQTFSLPPGFEIELV